MKNINININIKVKNIAVALSLICSTKAIANDYMIIIPTEKDSIRFVIKDWEKTDPLFLEWVDVNQSSEYYRFNCLNWTPETSSRPEGEVFTQASGECSGKQVAKVAGQEKNIITGETRQTNEYIDSSKEQIISGLSHTRDAIGTKSVPLKIIDPVVGVNGIYQISDGKGGTNRAYVNMTDDGGKWILVARWVTSPYSSLTWSNFGVKGNIIKTYSNDELNYPALPVNTVNTSTRMMFKGGSAGWKNLFGEWQSFDMFENTSKITKTGFVGKTSLGTRTMFLRSNGWPTSLTSNMSSPMGLHTQYGNSGPCGGENRNGSNPICITLSGNSTAHFDTKSLKEFYIKASD